MKLKSPLNGNEVLQPDCEEVGSKAVATLHKADVCPGLILNSDFLKTDCKSLKCQECLQKCNSKASFRGLVPYFQL